MSDKRIVRHANHLFIERTSCSTDPPSDALAWSAVATYVCSYPLINKSKRAYQNCGSRDPESVWAKARVQLCTQFYKQLLLGLLNDPLADQYKHDILSLELKGEDMTISLNLHEIFWWDEHHKKCILGPMSKHETRIWQNDEGVPTKSEDGGVLPQKKKKTSMKYVHEARECFGVAMRRTVHGYEGVKAAPFNYSSRWIVGNKNYQSKCNEEIRRVKQLKEMWGKTGEGYPQRYPPSLDYMNFVRAEVYKHTSCITEVMDHVVAELTKIYTNTPVANTFMIFHDGLSAWWEKEAQEYMATLGFRDR